MRVTNLKRNHISLSVEDRMLEIVNEIRNKVRERDNMYFHIINNNFGYLVHGRNQKLSGFPC